MTGTVLILGATSSLARHVSAALARRGHALFLAARDAQEAERAAADLRVRFGVPVASGAFDAEDYEGHAEFVGRVEERAGELGGVVLAFGYLGEQESAERDMDEWGRIIGRNFAGAVSVLNLCAERLEARRGGFVVGISSVAGDVGRQSNYMYGASKAGLNVYLQGLRNRLFHAGVNVLTVKPGYVDTPMTYGKPRVFLAAPPEEVGEGIVRALERGRNVVYLPWFWRWIMLALKILPEGLRKRLKL
jgi:decaprenylphospho-beta-D-erythro-pentofuranosid-2-ulose 2-reductase